MLTYCCPKHLVWCLCSAITKDSRRGIKGTVVQWRMLGAHRPRSRPRGWKQRLVSDSWCRLVSDVLVFQSNSSFVYFSGSGAGFRVWLADDKGQLPGDEGYSQSFRESILWFSLFWHLILPFFPHRWAKLLTYKWQIFVFRSSMIYFRIFFRGEGGGQSIHELSERPAVIVK